MSIQKLKLGEVYIIRKGTSFSEMVKCIDVASSGTVGMCESMNGRVEIFTRTELDYSDENMISIWRD